MHSTLTKLLTQIPHRSIAFLACVLVLVGMYLSRAMMSIGMMVLIGNALINHQVVSYWKSFRRQPHLLILSLYFLYAALSVFWSTDKPYYLQRMQVLLPFLTLPFAFISIGKWENKWVHLLLLLFVVLNVGGIGWSLIQYYSDKQAFDAGYHYSHQIPTPFKRDHIRFSLSVVMSILFCIRLIKHARQVGYKMMLAMIIILDVLYLHILSVKSGLIAFYIVAALQIGYALWHQSTRRWGALAVCGLIILPLVMYYTSVTFRTKIGYVLYSIQQIQNDKKEVNISDEGRLISYGYALELIREHPVTGVGYGDVFEEMRRKFDRDFGVGKIYPLIPHNQFLMSSVALGLPGGILILLIFVLLWRQVRKQDFVFACFMTLMTFACVIEAFFENQYGVCLFLFFLLLLIQRKHPIDSDTPRQA